jgi:M3 family oligoendopeptidase
MQTFKDYKYERPNIDELVSSGRELIEKFQNASSYEEALGFYKEFEAKERTFETMYVLTSIRNSIDTTDEFYDAESKFFAENSPRIQQVGVEFGKALVSSKFRKEFEEAKGEFLFIKLENQIKTFDPAIMEDLQEENLTALEYDKLISSAQIEYDGEVKTLAQLAPYLQNPDRNVRKEASDLYFGFMSENVDKFDEIYDKLVKVRTRIAKKLGFETFTELGYLRMGRTDYNAEDVARYRGFIEEYVVPLSNELRDRQAKRIGVDKLMSYDVGFEFPTGNPKPKGEPEWIINEGIKMYDELSPETSEFFHFMHDRELLDLVAKKGKRPGGYCTYISDYESPFIFSNFNGTQHDVEVLTHEVGHAFQVYQSRNLESAYRWPTYEAAEIHSMSMEFLTYPWMENFFQDEIDKFRFSHIQGAALFLPYGASVDEFQHYVYATPEATPVERRAKWREIEKKYTPYKNYDGNEYLETGGLWQKQSHIYSVPFYYIDYTLAQICALQFFKKSQEDREQAWKDYLGLCKLGGSKPFLGLVEAANLKSPFQDGLMDDLMSFVKNELDQIDDSEF